MEQEGERLSKKTDQPMSEAVQKTSAYRTASGAPEVVSSTNPQGGVHQEEGAASSSTIQGGEQDPHAEADQSKDERKAKRSKNG